MLAYSPDQIQNALCQPAANGWQLDPNNGEIFKQFRFANFVEALHFVNQVGQLAEELGHHPDITIKYNRVILSVVTHDANGLTDLDFQLAARVNQL